MLKKLIYLNNFNISIFRKHNIIYLYIYNVNYFSLIRLSPTLKLYLRNQKCLEILQVTYNNINLDLYLNKFLKQFFLCEYSKIKFSGKGYKIKKNSTQSLILLFNRAHLTTVWWRNIFLKKYKKYKIYINYTDKNKYFINTVLKIRYINIFTKKGLRESRQIILKKKGKK